MERPQIAMELLYTLLVALGLGLVCTPLAMDVARRLGIMDKPNSSRKIHTEPKPYLGGVAIYIAFIVATLLFTELNPEILAIIAGGTVMMVVGALDDKFDLSPKLRLVIQFACALFAVWAGVRVDGIGNPFNNEFIPLGFFSWPLTILWIMAITNVMNFIDGIDGLAAGTTVIVCITLILVAWREGMYSVMLMGVALIGASLGFLRYNFHPAKIFMGDAGAYFIGYALGCLSVIGPMKQAAFMTVLTPVLALGLPIFDTAVVMFRRIRAGQSPMHADRTYAHHRLLDSGFSQRQTVLWLYAISTCFGLAAVSITTVHGRLVAFITGVIGLWLFGSAQRLERKRINNRRTKDLTSQLGRNFQTTRDYSEELSGLGRKPEKDKEER